MLDVWMYGKDMPYGTQFFLELQRHHIRSTHFFT